MAAIRRRVEGLYQPRQKVSTSVDLPLKEDAERTLMLATEESEALGHSVIDARHMLLGLLRVEGCAAGDPLRDYGIEYAPYCEVVRKMNLPGSGLPPA